MFCKNCGERIEEASRFCKGCGATVDSSMPKKSKVLPVVLTILLICGSGFGIQQYLLKEPASENPVSRENTAEKEPAKTEKKEIIKAAQKKVYTIVTESGIGSGFLFTKDGMVVTNAHVVAGYTDVMVRNSEGDEEPGRVIGISDIEDIAVIQVAAYKGQEPLPAEMNVTDVGSEVIALGSPNGFENSASIGYLTGVDRDISFDFEYEDIYQVDAQIAPGSSGGPLIDAENGKVIGINSLLYTDGNAIGFSIPLHSVHDSLMNWVNNPMSAAAVASVFDIYESYDVFDWLEDYDYETDTAFDYDTEWDTEAVYEEKTVVEEVVTWEETYEYEEETSEEYAYEEETYEEESYEEEAVVEESEAEEEIVSNFDESSLSMFVEDYRANYEMALANEDFSYVADMLQSDSAIYQGISDYLVEISGQGMIFEFIESTILGVESNGDYALVHTYESFDFMNAAGEWTFEERYKTYTVVADEYGGYLISDITKD